MIWRSRYLAAGRFVVSAGAVCGFLLVAPSSAARVETKASQPVTVVSCADGIPSTLRIANNGALLGRSGPLRFQRFGAADGVPEPPGPWGVKWSVVVVGRHTLELRSYQPSVGFVFGSAPATWQVPAGTFVPIRRLVLEPCASRAATVFVGGLSYLHRPACARFVITDDATDRT